jgi:hypothetical protein
MYSPRAAMEASNGARLPEAQTGIAGDGAARPGGYFSRRHEGSGDKPESSLLKPKFIFPKSLNPRPGYRVFYASRQCVVPGAATTQNSGGTKPFSEPAKTSGNRPGISIDHRIKGRKGP